MPSPEERKNEIDIRIHFDGLSPTAREAAPVTQERLTLERLISLEVHGALKRLKEIREEIKQDLLAGMPVEEGPLKARVEPRHRNARVQKECDFLQLIIE